MVMILLLAMMMPAVADGDGLLHHTTLNNPFYM